MASGPTGAKSTSIVTYENISSPSNGGELPDALATLNRISSVATTGTSMAIAAVSSPYECHADIGVGWDEQVFSEYSYLCARYLLMSRRMYCSSMIVNLWDRLGLFLRWRQGAWRLARLVEYLGRRRLSFGGRGSSLRRGSGILAVGVRRLSRREW